MNCRDLILIDGAYPLAGELERTVVQGVGGAQQLRISFVRELLLHSGHDRIILATHSSRKARLAATIEAIDVESRAQVWSFMDFSGADFEARSPVVHCLGPTIAEACHISTVCGAARWPVTGMTHDLFDPAVFKDLLTACALPTVPPLAIACSSLAARSSMRAMLRRLSELRGRPLPIALPHVPHGIENSFFDRLAKGSGQDRTTAKLEARSALDMPTGHCLSVYLGRLSLEAKADLATLVDVFRSVSGGPATLVLAGSADSNAEMELAALIERAQHPRADRRVILRPNVTEAEKEHLLCAADIFTSPANSLQESFGLALIEAMAAGLPVIASDWNGYRDIVRHRVTGLLVPTVCDIQAVAALGAMIPLEESGWLHGRASAATQLDRSAFSAAFVELEGNPELRTYLGSNGRAAASRFRIGRMVGRYERLWDLLRNMDDQCPRDISLGLAYDPMEAYFAHPTHWRGEDKP